MNKTILDYLGFIITSIGTVLGAIGILSLKKEPDLNLIQWSLIGFAFLFFFLFLIFLKSSIRNKRYKKAYSKINKAFAIANELNENEKKINDLPSCIKTFELFCSHIANTFELLTNRKCSACIKLFEQDNNLDVCIMTFCRDSQSKISDNRVSPENDSTNHFLRENTDFKLIFENIDKEEEENKSYFSNSLPLEDFYLNTRINYSNYPPKCKTPILKEIKRCIKWPLPYRSTITVPITLFSNSKINEGKIAGYLCVDSPKMSTFNKLYDVQILRGIADGIYTPIRRINEIHFNNIHKSINNKQKTKQL